MRYRLQFALPALTLLFDGAPTPDRFEVEEARFFALDALPEATSAATRRRIEEYLGARRADGSW